MTPPPKDSVPREVRKAAEPMTQFRPMRRGSLSVRYVKCSKEGCGCAQDPEARHGPYYSLTRSVSGKTRSRYLSPEQADKANRQIEAAHQFRQQLEAYWQACESWADQELETELEGQAEALEKKGSKRGSKKKSDRKRRG